MRGTGQGLDFQFHQALRGEADHIAEKVGVSGLLQQLSEVYGLTPLGGAQPLTNGHILSSREIREHLNEGAIFKRGSWREENLRAVAYDLRMARDLMVVPDRPTFKKGRFYPKGEERRKEVILDPGDVAFISTAERLCLPWNVSGHLGTKFSLAAKGIITLTGSFVDPGYGLALDESNRWSALDDQRLHFLFANVGAGPVVLRPGEETIACIQLISTEEQLDKKETQSGGFLQIVEYFPDPQRSVEAGLVFFKNMADIRDEALAIGKAMQEVERNLSSFSQRLQTVESGSNQIVMFGVYLMCVTFIGVLFTFLLQIASVDKSIDNIKRLHELVLSHGLGIVAVVIGVLGISKIVFDLLRVAGRLFRSVAGSRR